MTNSVGHVLKKVDQERGVREANLCWQPHKKLSYKYKGPCSSVLRPLFNVHPTNNLTLKK